MATDNLKMTLQSMIGCGVINESEIVVHYSGNYDFTIFCEKPGEYRIGLNSLNTISKCVTASHNYTFSASYNLNQGDRVYIEAVCKDQDMQVSFSAKLNNMSWTARPPRSEFSAIYTKTSERLTNKPCSHEWTRYVGFTDVYEFCTKCDKKNMEL